MFPAAGSFDDTLSILLNVSAKAGFKRKNKKVVIFCKKIQFLLIILGVVFKKKDFQKWAKLSVVDDLFATVSKESDEESIMFDQVSYPFKVSLL